MAHHSRLIIGGNIGKNKDTPNEDAYRDYEICFRELFDVVDYFVVNVSSPNTPGLRELQDKDSLIKILSHLQLINKQLTPEGQNLKPLLVKIAPDLTEAQLDDLVDLAKEVQLDGVVATNTTISRENLLTHANKLDTIGMGGLSGAPLLKKSNDIIRYLRDRAGSALLIIGSGGIISREDASEKLNAGANLVQLWTGFIYGGPALIRSAFYATREAEEASAKNEWLQTDPRK